MRFLIVTGLSGAGKSQAVKSLEDIGYYCIDNMPTQLIYKFAELCISSRGQFDKVALVCDIRGGGPFDHLLQDLDSLRRDGHQYEILFLDADDDALISRYKETRRNHPLKEGNNTLLDAIKEERELLQPLKERATNIIDTSDKLTQQTVKEIKAIYTGEVAEKGLSVSIISFGFKHGMPRDCDMMFDVRFLPNPYYIKELAPHTGMDGEVSDYVMSFDSSKEFSEKLKDMIHFLLPCYVEEGRMNVVIAIGCTGGKHRSVTIAEMLTDYVKSLGYRTQVFHRDLEKK